MATMTVDRVIELAEELGYGVDIDFTGKRGPIVSPFRGRSKSFKNLDEALAFLLDKRIALQKFGG